MKLWMGFAAALAVGFTTVSALAQEHDHAAMVAHPAAAAGTAPAPVPTCKCPCCMKMQAEGAVAKPMQCPMHQPAAAASPAMNHAAMEHDAMGAMQMGGMNHKGGMKCPMMQMAPVPAGVLRIRMDGKDTDWKLADLAALAHKTVTLPNAHTKTNQSFSGVPLIDLLLKAGVPAKLHGKDLALYVAAVGSDGYTAVLSMAEVHPDVHEGTVLVADQLDGKPIDAQGPLMLVVAGEARPARWVRNLVQIKVAAAE